MAEWQGARMPLSDEVTALAASHFHPPHLPVFIC